MLLHQQEVMIMDSRILTPKHLDKFREHLIREEKSEVTRDKYLRDVRAFAHYAAGRVIEKSLLLEYKSQLIPRYAVRSINSMLASLNSFFRFMGWTDCQVKNLRFQRQSYCAEETELSKAEYLRLLDMAAQNGNDQLRLVMQTLGGTGIRISELQYFTVESVRQGKITVRCKSKTRVILIPGKLKKLLLTYAKRRKIGRGRIFITKNGNPLDRSNVWAQMKKLCAKAGVDPRKVFPHNFRKLFARTFYRMERDIAKLADILGHGNIETTRIYIMTTGSEHLRKIERLGLVV